MSKSRKKLGMVLVCLAIAGFTLGTDINNDSIEIIGILAELNSSEKSINFAKLLKLMDFYDILIGLLFVVFSLTILLLIDNHSTRKKLLEIEEKINSIQDH